MSTGNRPWERRSFAWEGTATDSDTDDEDDSSVPVDQLPPEVAGEELANYIIDLKNRGVLNATQGCILCFWATQAKAAGELIKKLAKQPQPQDSNVQTGAYSRHWDTVLREKPADARDWYELETPMYLRAGGGRSVIKMATLPVHEVLNEEIQGDKSLPARLEEAKRNGMLPKSYFDKAEAMGDTGEPIYPLAFYSDGVKYSRTNNVLGMYVYNVLTGRRWLIAAFRKAELCKCGCRHWCSIYAMWVWLHWALAACFAGRFPSTRHDGSPFHNLGSDESRSLLAGQRLGWRGVVLFCKGDWAEVAASYGYWTWSSHSHPCFLCWARNDTFLKFDGLGPLRFPLPLKTFLEYQEACRKCEIVITLSEPQLRAVKACVIFPKKKQGQVTGCVLSQDISGTPLRKNDRLEPSRYLSDVFQLKHCEPGCTLLFWRSSCEGLTHHRCPLWDSDILLTPDALQIDWLHALSLGVFQDFCGHFIQHMFSANVWCMPTTGDAAQKMATPIIEEDLFAWYKEERRLKQLHTAVQRLDYTFFGTKKKPKCALHGSETNGFLCYLVSFADRKNLSSTLPNGESWVRLGHCLVRIYKICRIQPQDWEHPKHVQDLLTSENCHPMPPATHAPVLHTWIYSHPTVSFVLRLLAIFRIYTISSPFVIRAHLPHFPRPHALIHATGSGRFCY